MENIPTDLLSLSPLVLVALFFIYEYFKSQKKNGSSNKDYSKVAAEAISNISENHLNHIECAIREGDSEIVKAINAMHLDLANRLSEMKGQIK